MFCLYWRLPINSSFILIYWSIYLIFNTVICFMRKSATQRWYHTSSFVGANLHPTWEPINHGNKPQTWFWGYKNLMYLSSVASIHFKVMWEFLSLFYLSWILYCICRCLKNKCRIGHSRRMKIEILEFTRMIVDLNNEQLPGEPELGYIWLLNYMF